MNLNQLYYFRTLGKHLYYTGAAEELNITQPSLSHAIRMLEQELGIRLFERSGRNIVMTKHGRELWQEVDKAIEILEQSQLRAKRMAASDCGSIDFAFIYTLGAKFIPKLIDEYINEFSDQKPMFNTYQESTENVIEDIRQGKIDLGFCSKMDEADDIIFTPVCKQEMVLITPKDHPLSKQKAVSLKETAGHQFVCYGRSSGLRRIIDEAFADIPRDIVYTMEEDSAVMGMVEYGFGIAVVPKIPLLKLFDIEIISMIDFDVNRYIYLAEPKGRYQPPVVQCFLEFIKNREIYQSGDSI